MTDYLENQMKLLEEQGQMLDRAQEVLDELKTRHANGDTVLHWCLFGMGILVNGGLINHSDPMYDTSGAHLILRLEDPPEDYSPLLQDLRQAYDFD